MKKNTTEIQEQAVNLNTLIDTSCGKYGKLNAVGMAMKVPISYQEMHKRILILAAHLQGCGVRFGDRVALLAENSHNWGTVYLAAVRLGAVCVPILPDLPQADVHHILTEIECAVIFTTQQQINKVLPLQQGTRLVVTLDDYQDTALSEPLKVLPFTTFLAAAQAEFAGVLPSGLPKFPEVGSDHPASILYTSGTSGFSKAVLLSHGNLCANAAAAGQLIPLEPGSVFLSVLPISHTYEFTVGFLMPLIKGACIFYAGKAPTPAVLRKLCLRERPHVLLIVPLIMEKIYKKQIQPSVEKSRLLSFLCRFSLGRRLVYRRIGRGLADFFGGRLKMIGIGGAALNPEVETFLRATGLPFLVGYGMTESSPLISGGPAGDPTISHGSAGKPVAGVEVQIDAPDPVTGVGEILARGPNIMQGYWNNQEETAKVLDDKGWLHTGDLGCFDEWGNLCLKGRSKSVIVLANGENVYPEAIEHKLDCCPLVVESLIIEKNGLLEALVYPDYAFVAEQTQGQSSEEQQVYITAELERIRQEINAQIGSMSRLSKIVEQQEPFVKTATHKIKRYLYTTNR